MVAIGTADVNFDKMFKNAYDDLLDEHKNKTVWKNLYSIWGKSQQDDEFKTAHAGHDNFFVPLLKHFSFDLKSPEEAMAEFTDNWKYPRLMVEKQHEHFRCLYADDVMTIVTLGGLGSTFTVPSKYVSVTLFADYDNLSSPEREALVNAGNASGAVAKPTSGLTVTSAKENLASLNDDMSRLKKVMEDTENGNVDEVRELKNQIEAMQKELQERIAILMADLQEKKAEMEQQKEDMENKIYMLESEIYSIRCYTGECVELHKVRTGSPAKPETPLILQQKMRYLDEELGKLASVYDVDFSDTTILEELISVNDIVFEQFMPSPRCMTLVRVSRDNKRIVMSEKYANMLDWTEKYRGRCIGILLRDGENLYITWTDEDRISFKDDFFFRPGVSDEIDPEAEKSRFETDESYQKRMKQMAKRKLDEAVGRSFIFSMLQGVVDRKMIRFPDGVTIKVNRPTGYIIRSFADGWITDERYGSFDEMMTRCNETVAEGDVIITMQHLHPELRDRSWHGDERWNNDRGIGERNRTHDVYAHDCTLYPINKVVTTWDGTIYWTDGEKQYETNFSDDDAEKISKLIDRRNSNGNKVQRTDFSEPEDHFYISLKKQWSYSDARANFEVFREEFVNLTYMNSAWLTYILQTQKKGDIVIGSQSINFAHLIPYLKKMLDFVRKREAEEVELLAKLEPAIADDPEWPAKLSEWKLEHGVRKITEYQAKRFVKAWSKERSTKN